MGEMVACIPNGIIPNGIYFKGNESFDAILSKIATSRFLALRDKNDSSTNSLEMNKSVRQLVVVLLIEDNCGKFLIYHRSDKCGENRLGGLESFPGGHMNSFTKDFCWDVEVDAMREMSEELTVTAKPIETVFDDGNSGVGMPLDIVGIIQVDNGNSVQQVHTGILVKIDASKFDIAIKEKDEMKELDYISKYGDILSMPDKWLSIINPWLDQIASLSNHPSGNKS
jgi:predicted NUDIX family phosphoesterase